MKGIKVKTVRHTAKVSFNPGGEHKQFDQADTQMVFQTITNAYIDGLKKILGLYGYQDYSLDIELQYSLDRIGVVE